MWWDEKVKEVVCRSFLAARCVERIKYENQQNYQKNCFKSKSSRGFVCLWVAGMFVKIESMFTESAPWQIKVDYFEFLLDESLLLNRGWIFQKRLPSLRTVYYTAGKIVFEYKSFNATKEYNEIEEDDILALGWSIV